MADVTFPSVPRVVSLLQYDDIESSRDSLPLAGYPVICVTVRPGSHTRTYFSTRQVIHVEKSLSCECISRQVNTVYEVFYRCAHLTTHL